MNRPWTVIGLNTKNNKREAFIANAPYGFDEAAVYLTEKCTDMVIESILPGEHRPRVFNNPAKSASAVVPNPHPLDGMPSGF